MNAAILLLAASLPMLAQQPAKPLPSWGGCGAAYTTSGSSRASAWCALGVAIMPSQQIYSYSAYWLIPTAKAPTTSTTTGFATILRTFPVGTATLYILGLATAGLATSSTATTGAFSGGGMGMLKLKSGITLEVGAIQNKAASVAATQVILGGGFTW